MVEARLKLNEYTTRVLDVIKGKYGLKNRSEALNRFAQEKGKKYVREEDEINPVVLEHYDRVLKEYYKKYGKKKQSMTLEEVDKLLGLKN